ncbi:MAG: molybdenum cofactor guanylyltransferase [Gemmatimonadales bacterium]
MLAGGESRRFGSDKTSALLDGETLLGRAAGTLARVFADVVVVSSAGARSTDRWPRVPDLHPGLGPLAGIEAALVHARDSGRIGAFVLACDMPMVDEATVRAVLGALDSRRAAAAGPAGTGRVEPLCAAYRLECLPEVSRALEERRLAAHELFASVGGVVVELPAARFLNVNTPEDHARALAVLPKKPA